MKKIKSEKFRANFIIVVILMLIVNIAPVVLYSQNTNSIIIKPDQLNIDADVYSVKPGDTIYIESGFRKQLRLANFHGDASNYIVFINLGGEVIFENDNQYGILIQNCSFFRLTGTGSTDSEYGIRILETRENASGMSINSLSTDFEIDHLEIANTGFAGIMAFSQPTSDKKANRGNFVQENTVIHDNYIHNTIGEGLYIGHSFYNGITSENSTETLYPHDLKGVRIYKNRIEHTGWDGMQVGCATSDCEIFDNKISNYGEGMVVSQHSGIQISGGTTGKCYNNEIENGSGHGISVFGLGDNLVYNNLILNAGYNYFPEDKSKRIYGIFCDDRSTIAGKSFNFINNTIISPKSDGIRFYSTLSSNNKLYNNVIINPGSIGDYSDVSQSYIYLNKGVDVEASNNYCKKEQLDSNMEDANSIYDFTGTLDVFGKGKDVLDFGISKDFFNETRPEFGQNDIGAFQFDSTIRARFKQKTTVNNLYPNPSIGSFVVENIENERIKKITITDINGMKIYENNSTDNTLIALNLDGNLKKGIYFVNVETRNHHSSEKLIIN